MAMVFLGLGTETNTAYLGRALAVYHILEFDIQHCAGNAEPLGATHRPPGTPITRSSLLAVDHLRSRNVLGALRARSQTTACIRQVATLVHRVSYPYADHGLRMGRSHCLFPHRQVHKKRAGRSMHGGNPLPHLDRIRRRSSKRIPVQSKRRCLRLSLPIPQRTLVLGTNSILRRWDWFARYVLHARSSSLVQDAHPTYDEHKLHGEHLVSL